MKNLSKSDDTSAISRAGIRERITFAELPQKLPGLRKNPLQSLIFNVMEGSGLHTIPFTGMVTPLVVIWAALAACGGSQDRGSGVRISLHDAIAL